ncbi:MAG: ubiquitin-like domain-containing protein [Galactobacter sp.]
MAISGKRILTKGAQGLTLGALVAGTVAFVGADKTVALTVDGQSQDVHTYGRTVADVLRTADVDVDSNDEVSAPLDSTVRTGSTVRVKLARSVTVDLDGEKRTVDTTADTVGDLAKQLGVSDDAELSLGKDVTLASSTSQLSVVTPKRVSLDLAGKRSTVSTTATDVADLLKEQGVKPDSDDVVTPALNTVLTDGGSVAWQRVETKKKATTSDLAAGTITVKTDNLEQGETKTVRQATEGKRTTVSKLRYVNGKVVSTEVISSEITTKPTPKLVQVGTKAPEKESTAKHADESDSSSKKTSSSSKDSSSKDSETKDSASSASKDSSTSASGPSGSVDGVWQKLAQCESGGNWSINSGNGYYGGLQFTASTWAAQGGTKYAALPHQATAAQQVEIAKKLQAKAGWGQWPGCTAKLGLR